MKRISEINPLPLYYQLKELLREQIECGALKPNQPVPSERELGEKYNISRMTARHALSQLEAEGFVYRKQGKGTFVAEPKIRQGLLKLTSFTEDMQSKGMKPGAKVVDMDVLSEDEELESKLGASPGEQFVKIQRVRTADGKPMALETSFLRRKFCPGIEEMDLNNRSLYKILEEQYQIFFSRAEQTLEPKLADEYEAQILGVDKGKPMLLMERTTFLEDSSTAIEYVRSVYRGDRYKFYIELTRS